MQTMKCQCFIISSSLSKKSQPVIFCTTLIFQMILKWRPCGAQAAIQSQSNKGINDHCKVPTSKKKPGQMEKISTTAAVWSSKCWSGSNKINCEPVSHTEHSLIVDNHPQAYFLLLFSRNCHSIWTYLVSVFILKKKSYFSVNHGTWCVDNKPALTAHCCPCFLPGARKHYPEQDLLEPSSFSGLGQLQWFCLLINSVCRHPHEAIEAAGLLGS